MTPFSPVTPDWAASEAKSGVKRIGCPQLALKEFAQWLAPYAACAEAA
jgi:hypothetical protein